MKDADTVAVDQAIAGLEGFDAILDARSPSEYAQDRLPGAINAPVLDDAQRALVGATYRQAGAFEAKRIGAALIARNIADIVERQLAHAPRNSRLLVYCWRGGNRSGALGTVLARIGWRTAVLEEGYRGFRRHVLAQLDVLSQRLRFVVIAGRTGSGKSLLLERLDAMGAQVLDLERLARHRGSVLGHLPQSQQPSQKAFDTLVWDRMRRLDPERPVIVESESRKIGRCQVPEQLILAMRASPCVRIEAADAVRCRLLLDEYRHFVEDPDGLETRLAALADHHGRAKIAGWLATARAGDWESFVLAMLHEHYDPSYERSMARNFPLIAQAATVVLESASPESLDAAARAVFALVQPQSARAR